MPYHFICPQCGKEFQDTHRNRKYCSKRCHDSARQMLLPIVCAYCKQSFRPDEQGRRYCSWECYVKSQSVPFRPCAQCGQLFQPDKKERIYCGTQCSNDAQRIALIPCEYCGKEFSPVKGKRFCSLKCFHASRRRHPKKYSKVCKGCGKIFYSPTSLKRQNYCSSSCFAQDVLVTRYPLICEFCGVTFIVTKKQHLNQKFCSRACYEKSRQSKSLDRFYYGPNWYKQRARALERDNYTCQQCKVTREQLGQNPDVHHITRFRNFDGDWKRANSLENLVALCKSCHKKAENDTLFSSR